MSEDMRKLLENLTPPIPNNSLSTGEIIVWVFVLGWVVTFFTGCAKPVEEVECGKVNQYQCVNLCTGLFLKRQSNWNRYFENELDCNVERNVVFEEYEAL